MTREQLDFLTAFKKEAIRYLIGYFFVSLGLAVGFYIDTKIKIGRLESEQEVIKRTQDETCHQVSKLYDMQLRSVKP